MSLFLPFVLLYDHTKLILVNHADNAPVLDTCFSADGQTVFSVGADKAVRMWQLGQAPPNNTPQQIGSHDAPIKSVGFLKSSNIVVSGGWDRKLKFWDMRQPNPVGVIDMPERVYDLDVRENLMVVATANRHIIAFNVAGQPVEHSRKESPLKFQSRCVSCFPDSTGFAVGSIEGRVGIHYLQKVAGKDSFAFKCHRQDQSVFSVNAIAFNNSFGTFATVGSDGVVNFWDKDNKQRLKGFNPIARPIPCASFNAQGNLFAYGSSYDWSKGSSNVQPGNEIFIHCVVEEEVRPKGKKSSGYKSR
jgi:mRNA export factor